MLLNTFSRFFARPVVRSATIYGIAGIAFAAANLVFARVLPPREFGLLALLIALVHVGKAIGTLGLNGVVNRHAIRTDLQLLKYGAAAGALCTIALLLFGRLVYDIEIHYLTIISVAIFAGSLKHLAAARFQFEHRFVLATSVTQVSNYGLALASVMLLIPTVTFTPMVPLFFMTFLMLVAATWSWTVLLRNPDHSARRIELADWSEAVLLAGVTAAWVLGFQLERMAIPKLFSLDQLAVYGVVAAFVVAPFKSLERGVASTLLPTLRAANIYDRRRILFRELAFIVALSISGGALICVAVPFLVDWLYGDKFNVSEWLVLAATIASALKLTATVGRTAVLAIGNSRQLGMLNLLTWGALGLSLIGAMIGADWGLVGAIYGISAGFLVQSCSAFWISRDHYTRLVLDQTSATLRPHT